jgi:large subunit ribosomal protein L25
MQTVAIEGNVRKDLGTSASRAIRRAENVPCVMYGGEEITHFYAHKNAFTKLVYTPEFKLAEITLEGKKFTALMKDLQFHPVTDELMHIDFIELVSGKKVKAEVPINITGSSPGEKTGGKLLQNMRKVKIFATPEKLVDSMSVDVSHLELGNSVRVRDLVPVEGVEVLSVGATPIASVEIPRALRSAMDETEKEERQNEDEE